MTNHAEPDGNFRIAFFNLYIYKKKNRIRIYIYILMYTFIRSRIISLCFRTNIEYKLLFYTTLYAIVN